MESRNQTLIDKHTRLGRIIRAVREAYGLSQPELAVEMTRATGLDIRQPTWSRYENASRAIDPVVLLIFCLKYEVTLEFLVVGDDSGLPEWLRAALRRGSAHQLVGKLSRA